ncbi:pyridoxamine 5'-phosphate oxidase family protein [Pseudactinotalea sp. Z1739]|uniref:pyridoxamine 5'-phosphate oxidase family protein n=1 Tax=Pseudactinotalea sp. Z1739 TaxID=3413028 RepID=UPI003C7A326A
MNESTPVPELDHRFSDADAHPPSWREVSAVLQERQMFWLSTARADGRPHAVPLPAIWHERVLYFATGVTEQKAVNLARSSTCVLSTGTADMNSGLDVAVESDAERVTDPTTLHRLAARWLAELDWPYDVVSGGFAHPGSDPEPGTEPVLVFAVRPTKILAFSKGTPFSQTRFRFPG